MSERLPLPRWLGAARASASAPPAGAAPGPLAAAPRPLPFPSPAPPTCLAPAPVPPPRHRPAAATLRELNGSIAENIAAKTVVSWGVSAISADPENMMVYPCE